MLESSILVGSRGPEKALLGGMDDLIKPKRHSRGSEGYTELKLTANAEVDANEPLAFHTFLHRPLKSV